MLKCQPMRERTDSSFLVNTVTESILIITQEHSPQATDPGHRHYLFYYLLGFLWGKVFKGIKLQPIKTLEEKTFYDETPEDFSAHAFIHWSLSLWMNIWQHCPGSREASRTFAVLCTMSLQIETHQGQDWKGSMDLQGFIAERVGQLFFPHLHEF